MNLWQSSEERTVSDYVERSQYVAMVNERDILRLKLARAKALLRECGIALDDWVHQYASEMCDEKHVQESVQRILDGGGTLAYVANLRQRIRELVDKVREWARSVHEFNFSTEYLEQRARELVNEAIEEAAKVADLDEWQPAAQRIAAAIRALKETK
jgi:hypothetical protein